MNDNPFEPTIIYSGILLSFMGLQFQENTTVFKIALDCTSFLSGDARSLPFPLPLSTQNNNRKHKTKQKPKLKQNNKQTNKQTKKQTNNNNNKNPENNVMYMFFVWNGFLCHT